MSTENLVGQWEERWHPLRDEWVIIAAHRQNRPWSGDTVADSPDSIPGYDPRCYLCPGNKRISGKRNPGYTDIFVFDNDHPCVGPLAPTELPEPAGIYRNRAAQGIARVLCYTPAHNVTLAELPVSHVENVVTTWQQQYVDLGKRSNIKNVTIFENKGEVCGVSNPHAHGQIYATNFCYRNIKTHVDAANRHRNETGRILFQDILAAEEMDESRIIVEGEHTVGFIPYFGRYAYEVYVAPKRTHTSIDKLSDAEASDLAKVLKTIIVKFDNLWQISFPYVMMLHQAPTDGGNYENFHFHIEFYPPLRKPNLLKYLGGPESGGGNFLADTIPAEKAAELRAASDVHYKDVE